MFMKYARPMTIVLAFSGVVGCGQDTEFDGVDGVDGSSESQTYSNAKPWCEGTGCSGTRLQGELLRAWDDHIIHETGGKKIQDECVPRYYQARPNTQFAGTVMFFHGFTACPQQYFDISEQLAAKGYDVFLPLMPGQGREPFDGPKGDDDNFFDLPGGDDRYRYNDFVERMNNIARLIEGPKAIAGLSGGGALATGAAIEGPDVWDRVLLYAPYYKNPGITGYATAMMDVFIPNFVSDWGAQCRADRRVKGGRAGLCALRIDAIRAMTDYGTYASKNIGRIEVPIQIAGVEWDPTADDGEIRRAYVRTQNAQLCFYPQGVPHSIINPKSDAPRVDPYWVASMQKDSIAFLTKGRWFRTDGVSQKEGGYPLCRSSI